jgi:hypothetical protein
LADRIIDPTPPAELNTLTPAPAGQQTISRTALAQVAEQGFNTNDLGFAFDEGETQPDDLQVDGEDGNPRPQARVKPAPAKKKLLGLQDTQIILLAGMFIVEICIVFGFGIILYLNL